MIDIRTYYNTYPYYRGYMNYPEMMSSCFCKKSYIRILNSLDKAVDVQINDILMAENMQIGEYTKYVKFPPASYRLKIHSKSKDNLLFESDIDIDSNLVYTAVISEEDDAPGDICVLMVPEEREHHMKGNFAALRLANLCPDMPGAVLFDSDGTILFSELKYGKVSCNIAVPSGSYILNLKTSGGDEILEYGIDAAPRMHYTLFLLGKEKDGSAKIILPEDGVNYLDLC